MSNKLNDDEIRNLHAIESNPFTEQDEELFAKFDNENLSTEERIVYIKKAFSNDDDTQHPIHSAE